MPILVLVESPAKCRAIAGYLGPGYRVEASFGHVRDLPPRAMGVTIHGSHVQVAYELSERGRQVCDRLRASAAAASEVILATDPDREGEAIAWHLSEVLGAKRYQRATFNAITRDAVRAAIAQPRALDLQLVQAQQARRVLDRVVGYAVSPTCARGVGAKEARSAGRVQSVALRLVVEREREIAAFTPVRYLVPIATLRVPGAPPDFRAALVEWKGEPLGTRLQEEGMAQQVVAWCRRQAWTVLRATRQEVRIAPPPPFITSTLQQAGSVRLKLTPAETMQHAQALYEAGAITYMRTDATSVSPEAVRMARTLITAQFPPAYLPPEPPRAANRVAHAQEAHEAIRPTSLDGGPGAQGEGPAGRLYSLIWERFVASQMAPGLDGRTVIDPASAPAASRHATRGAIPAGIFRARGTTVLFDGWRRLTSDASLEAPAKGKRRAAGDAGDASAEGGETSAVSEGLEQARLPSLSGGEDATLVDLEAKASTTKAPARYTEASLIRVLERRGIGRPSTYAGILGTIIARTYVRRAARKLHATDLGMRLCRFLERAYAGNFIEPDFTHRVEEALDAIARGERAWEPFVVEACTAVVALARAAGLREDPLAAPVRPR